MPKYDAFGREIGENTLAGLGSTSAGSPTPEWPAPRADDAEQASTGRPASPGDRQASSAEDRRTSSVDDRQASAAASAAARPTTPAPTTDRKALAAQLRGGLAQVAAARAAAGGAAAGRPARRSTGRGCLGAVAALLAVGLVVGGNVKLGGESGSSDGPARVAPAPVAPVVPRGVSGRSLVRRANLQAALRQLRATELRLTHLRVAPERIDAQLLTRGGRLRSVQIRPGGKLERFGPDSGPGFDSSSTIPFARLDPAAPQRLARRGAAKLRVPVNQLQYVVPSESGGNVSWGAYFTRSRYVLGDANGRYVRSYP